MTTNTATDTTTATMTSTMAMDTMDTAAATTTTTTTTTPKHQVRKKYICSKCGASIYYLRRHVQNNYPGVGNTNVPITLFKNKINRKVYFS